MDDEPRYAEFIRCPVKIDGGHCFCHWCQDYGCADEGDDDYEEKARAEIARINAEEFDALYAHRQWQREQDAREPVAVQWDGDEPPF